MAYVHSIFLSDGEVEFILPTAVCYEAWHVVSYRAWDEGGVGLYSAAINE